MKEKKKRKRIRRKVIKAEKVYTAKPQKKKGKKKRTRIEKENHHFIENLFKRNGRT